MAKSTDANLMAKTKKASKTNGKRYMTIFPAGRKWWKLATLQ